MNRHIDSNGRHTLHTHNISYRQLEGSTLRDTTLAHNTHDTQNRTYLKCCKKEWIHTVLTGRERTLQLARVSNHPLRRVSAPGREQAHIKGKCKKQNTITRRWPARKAHDAREHEVEAVKALKRWAGEANWNRWTKDKPATRVTRRTRGLSCSDTN